jgi:hypothetical protein
LLVPKDTILSTYLTIITQSAAVTQLAQLGLKHDIETFARSVMVSDTQKRLIDTAFPSELRLYVLKAGVLRGTTCNLQLFRSWRTVEDLRNLAYNLLLSPPREHWYERDPWADQETTDIIRSTAEQAFLETVMFQVDLTTSFATLRHRSGSFASPAFLKAFGAQTTAAGIQYLTLGARMHHLHLSITVYGSQHYGGSVSVIVCRGAIECMEALKLHFPSLRACVLTLYIHADYTTAASLVPFKQSTLQWNAAGIYTTDSKYTSFASEIAELFDAFAANGPGKSQFVRITKISEKGQSQTCHYGPLVEIDRRKMATESQDGSLGDRLLKDAYRLARTS